MSFESAGTSLNPGEPPIKGGWPMEEFALQAVVRVVPDVLDQARAHRARWVGSINPTPPVDAVICMEDLHVGELRAFGLLGKGQPLEHAEITVLGVDDCAWEVFHNFRSRGSLVEERIGVERAYDELVERLRLEVEAFLARISRHPTS